MIVPMKKVTIITLEKETDASVLALRKLGVLHVQHEQLPKGEEINSLKEKINLVNTAREVLSAKEFALQAPTPQSERLTDWVFTAKHIIDLRKRSEQLKEYAATLASKINQLEPWGDFPPEQIEELAKKNIFIRLYQIPLKEIPLLPQGVVVKKLFSRGGIANCALISFGKVEIPFKELPLPKMGLEKLRKRLSDDEQRIQSLKEEMTKLICYRQDFLSIKESLESELELRQAIKGMTQVEPLAYLSSYVPFDKVDLVRQVAISQKWGLVVVDPSQDDNVPVLIRNSRWISLISPIFKFLEILPGYRELDISLPFLIFFSIFFGILIGDAGYGLVYSIITFFLQKKAQRKGVDTSSFFLFYTLSLCAVIWGLLTGTFFGREWVIKLGYRPLLPSLNDAKNLQRFCFFLGALHLSLAHAWRAMLKLPSLSALADVGWGCILWAAFFLARTLILADIFPPFAKWLIILGITLVILFTQPEKNIFKAIGKGTGTLALGLMNNFTDVVSYVRLFAVGLAGVAIADAFNAMAGLVGTGNVLAIIGSALIVVIGQALAAVLGPVSVLVHGVRLNVLEFSGHANISWSGMAYKPLKE